MDRQSVLTGEVALVLPAQPLATHYLRSVAKHDRILPGKSLFGVVKRMCINPRLLETGALVSCRVCWQCVGNRRNDWVGRCIAEAKASLGVYRLTLTYGRDPACVEVDHPHASVLAYSDVQIFLKLLRYHHGGGIRFFCAGEYGERKARSHFHLLLFCKKKLPADVKMRQERFEFKPWPHGFVYFEDFSNDDLGETVKGFRYVVKYLNKDQGETGLKSMGLSIKPPLGSEYFKSLALEYVTAGLSPTDFNYRFPMVLNPKGYPLEFWINGSSRYSYLKSFYDQWTTYYGNENWPQSDLMDDFCVERERRERRKLGLPDFDDTHVDDMILNKLLERRGLWAGSDVYEDEKIRETILREWRRNHVWTA